MSRSVGMRRRTPGALGAGLLVAGLLVAGTAAPSGATTDPAPELVTPPQVSRTVPEDLSPFILDLDVQVRDDLWPAQPLSQDPTGG